MADNEIRRELRATFLTLYSYYKTNTTGLVVVAVVVVVVADLLRTAKNVECARACIQ